MDDSPKSVSVLLEKLRSAERFARKAQSGANAGDTDAARSSVLRAEREIAACRNRLFDVIYAELREVAMRVRRADSPVGATSLVNQAYTRLIRNEWAMDSPTREEFFRRAGRVLQQTLVDQLRRTRSLKAGGGMKRLPIDERIHELESRLDGHDLLDLEAALERLEAEDPDGASIVRLHFFGGLSFKELAGAIEMGERTVFRKWESARKWLYGALGSPEISAPDGPNQR